MVNDVFELCDWKPERGYHGDSTRTARIKVAENCTVADFVAVVLGNEEEWGSIGVLLPEKVRSALGSALPYATVEYEKGGKLKGENGLLPYYGWLVTGGEYNGGWSMGNYLLGIKPAKLPTAALDGADMETRDLIADIGELPTAEHDAVYHPKHYREGMADAIDAVVDGLPASRAAALWNVLKYFERAGKKGDAEEDLRKANNYAWRAVTGKFRWEAEGGGDGAGLEGR